MKRFTVKHSTRYRYARAVAFGQHRLMLRPRDSHDLRLVDASLRLSPPGNLRWLHDVYGNSVALVDFTAPASELAITSTLTLERYGLLRPEFPLDPDAETYPFVYSASDRSDLGRLLEPHYPDPNGILDAWAKGFAQERPIRTLDLVSRMNKAIRSEFAYSAREEQGTQTPLETLERRSGTCRDYALLLIEGARVLGLGARFVSGYLYDPALDGGESGLQGAGATHAWVEIYLPGAGWVEYDPTNGLIAAESLVRVAVTRDPAQAIPVSGTYEGEAEDFLGLEVEVTVTAQSDSAPVAPAMAPAA